MQTKPPIKDASGDKIQLTIADDEQPDHEPSPKKQDSGITPQVKDRHGDIDKPHVGEEA
ncbi:hypothetical protein YSY43_21330 [Paenibacillus sp. YSY-4.3]